MPLHGDDIVGMFALLMTLGIPIVAIMTSHQRKMARMFQENARQGASSPETQMLRDEVRELKSLVHQQAIALDNLVRPTPSETRIQERVA